MSNNRPLPKAVLFDFDGVVVDSSDVHYKAWSSAYLELFKVQIPPFPSLTHAGKAPIVIAQFFCDGINQPGKAEELYLLKSEHLHVSEQAPNLLPGLHEILFFLVENKIPYGVASNATRQFLTNSIRQLKMDFSIYTGVEDYVNPKPHPEAYISLAKKLNVQDSDFGETWVFEDSLTGTKAAKLAGMIPIGILAQHNTEALKKAGSQLVFKHLLDALNYLKG
jgi:beta-phosphoglucomutase